MGSVTVNFTHSQTDTDMQGCLWCQRVWACLSRDVKSIETDNKRKTPHRTQTTAHGETCQERNHITFKMGLHRTVLRCCCLRFPVEKWPPVPVLTPGSEPYLRLEPQSHTPTLIPAENGWTASHLQSDTATADGPTRPPSRLQIMWHFSIIRTDCTAQRLPRVSPDRRRLWGSDYKSRLM